MTYRVRTSVGSFEALDASTRCVFSPQLPPHVTSIYAAPGATSLTCQTFDLSSGTVVWVDGYDVAGHPIKIAVATTGGGSTVTSSITGLSFDMLASGAVAAELMFESAVTGPVGGTVYWYRGIISASPDHVQTIDGQVYAATARAATTDQQPGTTLKLDEISSNGRLWLLAGTTAVECGLVTTIGAMPGGSTVAIETDQQNGRWTVATI